MARTRNWEAFSLLSVRNYLAHGAFPNAVDTVTSQSEKRYVISATQCQSKRVYHGPAVMHATKGFVDKITLGAETDRAFDGQPEEHA